MARPPWLGHPEVEADPTVQQGDSKFAMDLVKRRAAVDKARMKAQMAVAQAKIDAQLAEQEAGMAAQSGLGGRLLARRETYKKRLQELAKSQGEQPEAPSSTIPEIPIDTQRPRPQPGLLSQVTEDIMSRTQGGPQTVQTGQVPNPAPGGGAVPPPAPGITMGGGPTGPLMVNQTTTSTPDQPLNWFERVVAGANALKNLNLESARAASRGYIPGQSQTTFSPPTMDDLKKEAGQMRLGVEEGTFSREQFNSYLERLQGEYGAEIASRLALTSHGDAAAERISLRQTRGEQAVRMADVMSQQGIPPDAVQAASGLIAEGRYAEASKAISQAGLGSIAAAELEGKQKTNAILGLQYNIAKMQFDAVTDAFLSANTERANTWDSLMNPGESNPWSPDVGEPTGTGIGISGRGFGLSGLTGGGRGGTKQLGLDTYLTQAFQLQSPLFVKGPKDEFVRDPSAIAQFNAGNQALLHSPVSAYTYVADQETGESRLVNAMDLIPASLAVMNVYNEPQRRYLAEHPEAAAAWRAEAEQTLLNAGIVPQDVTAPGSTARSVQLTRADQYGENAIVDEVVARLTALQQNASRLPGGYEQLLQAAERAQENWDRYEDRVAAASNRTQRGALPPGSLTLELPPAAPVKPGAESEAESERIRAAANMRAQALWKRQNPGKPVPKELQYTPLVKEPAPLPKAEQFKYSMRARAKTTREFPRGKSFADWLKEQAAEARGPQARRFSPGAPETYSPITGETAVPERYPQQNPRALFRAR